MMSIWKKVPHIFFHVVVNRILQNQWEIEIVEQWKRSTISTTVEFFYNSLFSAKSWQNPASIDGKEKIKKIAPAGY